MKILVVHRQKEITHRISEALHYEDPVIRYFDSGLEGLLATRIESFDLIVCSANLPVITGMELVKSIRANSINKHVPTVFIVEEPTGNLLEENVFVFTAEEFISKIPNWLVENKVLVNSV